MDDIINGTDKKLGEKLVSKEINVQWNIVKIKDEDTQYGNGWYYIDKGTEIENYGPAQNRWIVNYETGELKQLKEEDKKVSIEDAIGITDGLIFNLDASIIDGVTSKEEFESKFDSSKVEFVNVDWNENSGVTKNSFKLDGVNDYIKIKYDDSLAIDSEGNNIVDEEGNNLTQKEILAKNGFTFEFYGILNGGTCYDDKEQIINDCEHDLKGIFSFRKGDNDRLSSFGIRCTSQNFGKGLMWSVMGMNADSDYTLDGNDNYQIYYPDVITNGYNSVVFIQLIVDCSEVTSSDRGDFYKAYLYINGNKVIDGLYNKLTWQDFIDNNFDELDTFEIGRVMQYYQKYWHYAEMDAYAIRLYNRALSKEEVEKNYKSSTNYHAILEN